MVKNRVLYCLWLLLAVGLFVLVNNIGTGVILILSAIGPVISALLAYIASKYISASVDAPPSFAAGATFDVSVYLKNKSYLPLFNAAVTVKCKNVMSRGVLRSRQEVSVPPKAETKTVLQLSSDFCGMLEVSLDEIRIFDFFSLFGFKVKQNKSCFVQIQPKLFSAHITLSQNDLAAPESDKYSMEKAGNDASETFMIREYVAGDPIKNIHWKLSNKADKLMVRELGLPIANNILLLFDSVYQNKEKRPSAEAIDAAVTAYCSLVRCICDAGLTFTAGYISYETKQLVFTEISDIDTAQELIDSLLKNSIAFSEADICNMLQKTNNKAFEHIVLVTMNHSDAADSLVASNRVTVLELGIAPSCKTAYTVNFDSENYPSALAAIEI